MPLIRGEIVFHQTGFFNVSTKLIDVHRIQVQVLNRLDIPSLDLAMPTDDQRFHHQVSPRDGSEQGAGGAPVPEGRSAPVMVTIGAVIERTESDEHASRRRKAVRKFPEHRWCIDDVLKGVFRYDEIEGLPLEFADWGGREADPIDIGGQLGAHEIGSVAYGAFPDIDSDDLSGALQPHRNTKSAIATADLEYPLVSKARWAAKPLPEVVEPRINRLPDRLLHSAESSQIISHCATQA